MTRRSIFRFAPSFVRCPWGTRVQSLLFDKREFEPTEALEWLQKHKQPRPVLFDESRNYWRARLHEPGSFVEGSLRTIQLGKGQSRVRAIIGCPKTRPRGSRRR